MAFEEQNIRTITIKRASAIEIRKNLRHKKWDTKLAVLAIIVGFPWAISPGVNYFLDQRKATTSYQNEIRMEQNIYEPGRTNESPISKYL